MHELISRHLAVTPRHLVRAGLGMFFLGTGGLLLAMATEVLSVEPAWFIPHDALGYTAAASLVCWGVWAMGTGMRQARESGVRANRSR